MTDDELIRRHVAERGVTNCPPGYAAGISALELYVGAAAFPVSGASYREQMNNRIQARGAAKERK